MTHDPETRRPGALQRVVADLAGRPLAWVLLLAVVIALPLAKAFTTKLPALPPVLRELPEFTLTDESGRPFGSEQLRGKVWVADFVYTSCSSVCPKLTEAMQKVKYKSRNMKGGVHLVSLTVDPKGDTPERLLRYAEANHALGTGDWSFLTGDLAAVRTLVKDGFGLGLGRHDEEGPRDPASELFDVSHGQQLVLVDPRMRVRGFYAADDAGINLLTLHMGLIANLEGVRLASQSR